MKFKIYKYMDRYIQFVNKIIFTEWTLQRRDGTCNNFQKITIIVVYKIMLKI